MHLFFRVLTVALAGLVIRPALAEAPRVSVDIAPLHSLIARVMEGIAEPQLIIPQNASPHDFALRPSQARALSESDIVFWIGSDLTPWFARAITSLAPDAQAVEVLDLPELEILPYRDAVFAHDDHDHGTGNQRDPHVWLDPRNAQVILLRSAEVLGKEDPANSAKYLENAQRAKTEIEALQQQIAESLARLQGKKFLLFHDGYQYFEHRFGLPAEGSVLSGDAVKPGAKRIMELRDHILEHEISCIFSESTLPDGVIHSLTKTKEINTTTLDPIGLGFPLGPELYIRLLSNMAAGFSTCLSD